MKWMIEMNKKTEKKRAKIIERIADLEKDMQTALQKKSHIGPEINLPKIQKEIGELRKQLVELK